MSGVGSVLKRLLAGVPGLELAFLFGSHASGTARPDSDVDLAVRFDRPLSPDLKQVLTESVAAELESDPDLQDILVLNLTRAVQVCVDIGTHILSATEAISPRSVGEVFDSLERLGLISQTTASAMRKAVGFRNVAVHNYDTISWAIVHTISRQHLVGFQRFAREIAAHLPDPGSR